MNLLNMGFNMIGKCVSYYIFAP